NALNVMRTVVELERAGISALTIEDTLLPAQFGRKSTDLISTAEGVGKIRAALEARVDPEMSIFARTNAAIIPVQEAISRVQQYQAAGADGITVPLMLVTYGNPELHDNARLAEMGVRVCVHGHAAYFAAIKATYDCLREQRQILGSESNMSATELTHTYTQPEDYVEWAKKFMNVSE
ncbi:oxaloacetate decarboxylase, partial [Pseudomonas syringae pv. actinidiae]|nr:oxaloacetate decarboxylase [Pseudomonas syringae pv. actinidiae]